MLLTKFFVIGVFLVAQPDGKSVEAVEARGTPLDTKSECEAVKKSLVENLELAIQLKVSSVEKYRLNCVPIQVESLEKAAEKTK